MPRKALATSKAAVAELVEAFAMLATPIRVRLLDQLAHRGELHVGELCRRLKLDQPAASHHLGLMRARGLVTARRDGKRMYYALNRAAFIEPCLFLGELSSARRRRKRG